MRGFRVAVVAAVALVGAAAWAILGDTDTAGPVDQHLSGAADLFEFDALEASELANDALKVETIDAPAVLETAVRGRLILSRGGECGEVPGVVLVLRNLASGKTLRTFGRFSKWEWRDLWSGDYEVSLDPKFAGLWSCEPQVFHVGRDERVSATVELSSTTRIAGWIGDGFDSAIVLRDVVLYARAYREGNWADGVGCRTPVTLSPSGNFCIEGWQLPSNDANRLRMSVSARGYDDVWTNDFAIDGGTSFVLDDLDVRMYLPTTVKGTVVDDEGTPMSRVTVRAFADGEDDPVATARTSVNGHYRLKVGETFRGAFDVEGSGYPTERTGVLNIARGETRVVDFTVRPYRGVITGRITVRGAPAVGWGVVVLATGLEGGRTKLETRLVGRVSTGADGEFTCTGAAPGPHAVYVSLPKGRRVAATQRFEVGEDGNAFLAIDVDADPASDIPVYVEISADLDGTFVGLLHDREHWGYIDSVAFDGGRATLRSPARGPVFLVVKGTMASGIVHTLIPLDLSSGKSPPTVYVDLLTTTLRVFPSKAESDGWWTLASATGDPVMGTYFNGVVPRLSGSLKREVTIHGLPAGRYTLRRLGDEAAEVSVVVGAGTVEVTAP